MANKKNKKKRTPIAPPVHSAPGTSAARPSAPPPPPGPSGAPAPSAAAPKPRKQTQSSRAAKKKKRAKQRNYLIGALVVLALLAAFFVPRIMSGRATSDLNTLGSAAGCSDVDTTGDSGASDHLTEGETTKYDPLPPSHGAHSPTTLPAGVYDEELSVDPNEDINIYKAVHSLEHGAVIVWHDKLEEDALDTVVREFRDEPKVLIAPFAGLKGDTHMALTAWGKMMTCEEASTDVVEKFVDIYRGARTAPEPNNPI